MPAPSLRREEQEPPLQQRPDLSRHRAGVGLLDDAAPVLNGNTRRFRTRLDLGFAVRLFPVLDIAMISFTDPAPLSTRRKQVSHVSGGR